MDNLLLNLLPYFLSLMITVSVMVITYMRRNVIGARAFSSILLLETVWTFGYIFELSTPTLAGKIFWDNIQWAPAIFAGVASFAFSMEYTGRMNAKTLRWLAFAAGVAAVFVLSIWLGGQSSLILGNPRLVQAEPISIYTYEYGPVQLVGSFYSYVLLFSGLFFLAKDFFRPRNYFRIQPGIIFLGQFLPVIGTFLSLFSIKILANRDISPLTFAIANVCVAIGLFRYRIFDLVPVARSSVMDHISDPVMVLDAHETILDINPAFEALVGLTKKELVKRQVEKVIPGLPPFDPLKPYDESGEYEFATRDGPAIFEISSKLFTGSVGAYSGRIVIFHNITRHKADENVLRSSNSILERRVYQRALDLEEANRHLLQENKIRRQVEQEKSHYADEMEVLYRLALELTDLPSEKDLDEFFAMRLKVLTHAYVVSVCEYNPSLKQLEPRQMILENDMINRGLKILGFDPRNQVFPVSRAVYERITSHVVEYQDNLSEVTFGVIPEVIARRLEEFFNLASYAGLAVIDQGELNTTFVLVFQKGVPAPNEGFLKAVAHLAAIAYRRRRAEQERVESDTRFQQMAELLPQIVFECGVDGQIKYVNQRAFDMFGYECLEDGMNFQSFIIPEQRKMALENYQKVLLGESPRQHEYQVQRKDGSQFPVLIYSTAILKDGRPVGMRGVIVDISDLKIAEFDLMRTNRSLRVTSRANQALVHASGMQTLYDEICRDIVEEGGYSFAWISLVDPDRPAEAKIAAYAGNRGQPVVGACKNCPAYPTQCHPVLKAVTSQEMVIVRDIYREPGCTKYLPQASYNGEYSLISLPLSYDGQLYGAISVYFDNQDSFGMEEIKVLREMASDVSFGIHTLQLRGQLSEAYQATLEGLVRALELRERETADHSQRVVQMTSVMARRLGLDPRSIDQMERGALLHDIGKLGIPDRVLLKEDDLSEEEWVIMRGHSELAFQIISPVAFLKPALEIPRYHHERWNGSGYPFGLKGVEIPLSARIFAVVDVWDALTHSRRYRPEWSEEDALTYLRENAGVQFDPKVVDVFLDLKRTGAFNIQPIDVQGHPEVTLE